MQESRDIPELRDYASAMQSLFAGLGDADWAVYMERVKLYGEEAALTWLKQKQDN